MFKMAYKFCIFLMLLLNYKTDGKPTEVQCPEFCTCDIFEGFRRAICQNKKLTTVEIGMPPQVDVLDLSYNQISFLENNIFLQLDLTNLKLLNLSHNKVGVIDLFAFEGLSELKTLDLSYNVVRYFQDAWFVSLSRLQELYLKGNMLTSINQEPKLNFKNLQVLDISDCRIESLHPGVLEYLPNLEVLDISSNYLLHLKVEVINPLTKLTILNAKDNNFKCKDHSILHLKNYTAAHSITYEDSCKNKKVRNNKQEQFQRMMVEPVVPLRNSWIFDEAEEKMKNITFIEVCNGTNNDTKNYGTVKTYIPYLIHIIHLSPEIFLFVSLIFGITLGMIIGCSCQFRPKRLPECYSEEDIAYPLFSTPSYRNSLRSASSKGLQRQCSAPVGSYRPRTKSTGSRKMIREDRNILLIHEQNLSDSTPVLPRKNINLY